MAELNFQQPGGGSLGAVFDGFGALACTPLALETYETAEDGRGEQGPENGSSKKSITRKRRGASG